MRVEVEIQAGRAFKTLNMLAETRPDGAGGPPSHRHAVHLGFGSDAES